MPTQTQLQLFIAEEVRKTKGKAVPVHAGRLECFLKRKVKCKKLHPNPHDEFCMPEIGPNAEIVGQYEHEFRQFIDDSGVTDIKRPKAVEPLYVQKIRPDGYMILNGHHRWAAAMRVGMKKIRIRIVNLTQEKDIERILQHSRHDKRVTLDLDEVVFAAGKDGQMEKPLHFPLNRQFKERLRLGIPGLFTVLATKGYDVWLYSSRYVSAEYISDFLRLYRTRVTGIITGLDRKGPKDNKSRKQLEDMMAVKYATTIHADNDTVLFIDNRTKEYREIPLAGEGLWAGEVLDIVEGLD